MLHILDLIDYWRDQLERARHEHDKPRAIVCGAMLWALGVRKGETFKTA